MHIPKTIMAVDKDAHTLSIVSMKLRNSGFDVITAGDAEEALDAINGSSMVGAGPSVDVLITDYQMRGISGIELAKRLRAQQGVKQLSVILLTSNGLSLNDAELAKAGVSAHLSKPFSPRDLLTKVDELIQRQAPNFAANAR